MLMMIPIMFPTIPTSSHKMSSKFSQSMQESTCTVSAYCTATSRAISAAASDFNLSKSEITELLAEPTLSLSETAKPIVSPSDTELGFSLLVAAIFHVHKVNHARIFTVYATLCSLRKTTYYAQNYARIIAASPVLLDHWCV